jgi:1-acyl-sn-glycerol-3-phosphate acyltransferase
MNFIRGILTVTLISANTVAACIPIYLFGFIRLFLPAAGRSVLTHWMDHIIDFWVRGNRGLFAALHVTNVEMVWDGAEDLSRNNWYMVVSNHQSWTDILILQTRLFGHIPPIKFFTKQQLIWVPFLGVAMWLLGFPYVRRLSKEQITANPQLIRHDQQATLAACDGFRNHPTTVLNFLEGTRFTADKHGQQDARFKTLLNPKIGGLAYVLSALNDKLHYVVDVTIEYPDGIPTFWAFMKGECRNVRMLIQCRTVPATITEMTALAAIRRALNPWVESFWEEKDARLQRGRAPAANNLDAANKLDAAEASGSEVVD